VQRFEELHLLKLFLEPPAFAPGALLEPFERRDIAAVGCEQRGFPRGKHRRRDVLVDRVIEGLLSFGRGCPRQIPQAAVIRDQDAPFVQPALGKRHQTRDGDDVVSLASYLHRQRALTPLGQRTKVQQLRGPGLMFV
jgi:hypothetical protein